MIRSHCTEVFKALDLSLDIVGLDVDVHPFLRILLVAGSLQQDPYLGVRKSETPINIFACLAERFINSVKSRRPEVATSVEVVDVGPTTTAAIDGHDGEGGGIQWSD